MYLTIREYQTEAANVTEILRQDEESFIPLISRAAGFRDYYCIDGGNGNLASVSLFENRRDGETFNKLAMNWVQNNLGPLLPMPPKIMSSEVLIQATGKVLVS